MTTLPSFFSLMSYQRFNLHLFCQNYQFENDSEDLTGRIVIGESQIECESPFENLLRKKKDRVSIYSQTCTTEVAHPNAYGSWGKFYGKARERGSIEKEYVKRKIYVAFVSIWCNYFLFLFDRIWLKSCAITQHQVMTFSTPTFISIRCSILISHYVSNNRKMKWKCLCA